MSFEIYKRDPQGGKTSKEFKEEFARMVELVMRDPKKSINFAGHEYIMAKLFHHLRNTHKGRLPKDYKEQLKSMARGKHILVVGPEYVPKLRELIKLGFKVDVQTATRERRLLKELINTGSRVHLGRVDGRLDPNRREKYDAVILHDVLNPYAYTGNEKTLLERAIFDKSLCIPIGHMEKAPCIINALEHYTKPGGIVVSSDHINTTINELDPKEIEKVWEILEAREEVPPKVELLEHSGIEHHTLVLRKRMKKR